MAPGQWSRPASLLIFGVRPNSPSAITNTSSCKPRSQRSVTRADTAVSNCGSSLTFCSRKLSLGRPPAPPGLDAHEGPPPLHEPASQQAGLSHFVAPVALPQLVRLL